MTQTLTRTGIVAPSSDGSDLFDPVTYIRNNALWSEGNASMYAQGLISARPTAGKAGRWYKPTDVGSESLVYYDDGSTWQTIGAGAATDAAAGIGSLRTLGAGALQAAAGNHTHSAAAITGLDTYLEPWTRPGAAVDNSVQGGGVVAAPVGTTTIVGLPASGRRVIKTVRVSAPTAGATVTLTLNGVSVFSRTFASAGQHPPMDVTWPVSAGDTTGLQAVVTGQAAVVMAVYGDRTDALVDRFALTSSSATGPTNLVASGTARTFGHLWVANLSTTATATATVRVDTSTILTLSLGPSDYYSDESAWPVTSAQALKFAGDGTNALTYVVSGR